MNKYILRTSLVWIVIVALVAFFLLRRSQAPTMTTSSSGSAAPGSAAAEMQPVAKGPAAGPESSKEAAMGSQPQTSDAALAPVQLTPESMQSIGVKLGTAEYKNLSDDIRATGTVAIDDRLISYVQVRFPGYIRKVFANATYQYVHKGQPLLTIYSPELVATQQEYLLAQQHEKAVSGSAVDGVRSGASTLTIAAQQRLAQWQVSPGDLAKLDQTGKPLNELTVNSPVSGYITERETLPNMSVDAATHLYTVADLSRVWVEAQVFQQDVGRLKPGDTAHIQVDAYPGKTFYGSLEQVLPQVDMATRTVRVRVAVSNPAVKLKPGMFVNVDFKTALGRQLVVPASAVIHSGIEDRVFLSHGDGNLEPRTVVLGPASGDDVVVLKGLQAHQQIVTSANFLIDSESQLQAASGSFTASPPAAAAANSPSSSPPVADIKVDFTTSPNPPTQGMNTVRVKLKGPADAAITGADVTVNFYMAAMPAMGMAAVTSTAKLSEKGGGLYEGSATLGSSGLWQTTITARKNGQTIVIKRLSINATGGM